MSTTAPGGRAGGSEANSRVGFRAGSGAPPPLALRGLTVGYRSHASRSSARRPHEASFALEGIDAEVSAGKLVCVLGANGSGKSTLLKTVAGFQAPLEGSVLFDGRPQGEYRENERARFLSVVLTEQLHVGMLTAGELVSLGRYPYTGWTGRLTVEDRRAVQWALDAVGARGLAGRPVMSLSDGERQKVMIARALAQEPHLIVLDEPTAFLDFPRKVEVMELLADLAHRGGRSVLLSTHELEIAQAIADYLWLIPPHDSAGPGGPADSSGTDAIVARATRGAGAAPNGAVGGSAALIIGTPEDLVLSGDFERLFAASGVRFDRDVGRFLFGRPPARRALLRGTGPARHWTERALRRVGIAALDPAAGSGIEGLEARRPPGGAERPGAVESGETGQAARELPLITVEGEAGSLRWSLSLAGATRGFDSIDELVSALEEGGSPR